MEMEKNPRNDQPRVHAHHMSTVLQTPHAGPARDHRLVTVLVQRAMRLKSWILCRGKGFWKRSALEPSGRKPRRLFVLFTNYCEFVLERNSSKCFKTLVYTQVSSVADACRSARDLVKDGVHHCEITKTLATWADSGHEERSFARCASHMFII